MRSIGAWKIKKLRKIVEEVMESGNNGERVNINNAEAEILRRVPGEWYDIWEMAYQEINRLISDFINEHLYRRG